MKSTSSAFSRRIWLVLGSAILKSMGQEVARVGEVVVGVDVGQPQAVAVGERGEGWHLGDQSHRRNMTLVLVVDIRGFRVERREGADGSLQHPHRVRVVAETVHEVLDVLVDVGVMGDLIGPRFSSSSVGAIQIEQIGHLEVGRMLT